MKLNQFPHGTSKTRNPNFWAHCVFSYLDVAQTAGPMLVEVGRHNAAAQLYMGVEMIKEAVDAFISAEEWNKVRNMP